MQYIAFTKVACSLKKKQCTIIAVQQVAMQAHLYARIFIVHYIKSMVYEMLFFKKRQIGTCLPVAGYNHTLLGNVPNQGRHRYYQP